MGLRTGKDGDNMRREGYELFKEAATRGLRKKAGWFSFFKKAPKAVAEAAEAASKAPNFHITPFEEVSRGLASKAGGIEAAFNRSMDDFRRFFDEATERIPEIDRNLENVKREIARVKSLGIHSDASALKELMDYQRGLERTRRDIIAHARNLYEPVKQHGVNLAAHLPDSTHMAEVKGLGDQLKKLEAGIPFDRNQAFGEKLDLKKALKWTAIGGGALGAGYFAGKKLFGAGQQPTEDYQGASPTLPSPNQSNW